MDFEYIIVIIIYISTFKWSRKSQQRLKIDDLFVNERFQTKKKYL